ncbi:hypothetical protein BDV3_003461 [Batrachochytrium dendrobatidis]
MSTSNQTNIPAAVLTEEEKQSIINAAKGQYKESIKSRRVEAVLVYSVVLYGKPPSFYSGWASGTTGHWGIVVDGLLHHLVFKLDEDRQPVGIEFERQDFKQQWIDEGKVTAKEEIGSTSLPLEAIKAVGESLILHFGDYRRLILFTIYPECYRHYSFGFSPDYSRRLRYAHQAKKIHQESHQENKKGNFLGRYC